uniref:Uncharacterized protein n=1 Tax=Sphaerodactylus townsendi TaxID=933632 RepID=A0ACB8E9U5_9SAUR
MIAPRVLQPPSQVGGGVTASPPHTHSPPASLHRNTSLPSLQGTLTLTPGLRAPSPSAQQGGQDLARGIHPAQVTAGFSQAGGQSTPGTGTDPAGLQLAAPLLLLLTLFLQ